MKSYKYFVAWQNASLCARQTRSFNTFTSTAFIVGLMMLLSSGFARANEPSRVVSVGGVVTEIVHALGEGDRLIGRDTTSTYPPTVLDLPDVGYMRRLSPEGVLAMSPDLILLEEGSGPPEALDALKEANVPMVIVSEGYTPEIVADKIVQVGEALGIKNKAQSLAKKVSNDFTSAASAVQPNDRSSKVMFVLSLRDGKVITAGANTAAGEIISLAGATNAITQITGYKQVSDEAVLQSDPDVILMMESRGNHTATNEDVLNHPAIAATSAGRNQRIVRMDGLLLLGFGPRTAQAVSTLNKTLPTIE